MITYYVFLLKKNNARKYIYADPVQPFEKTVKPCRFLKVVALSQIGYPIFKMGDRKYQSGRDIFVFVYAGTLKLYFYLGKLSLCPCTSKQNLIYTIWDWYRVVSHIFDRLY